MNNKLSLAIPTYNRPEILAENLEKMLPELMEYQIPVYISDDSDNDKTMILIESLQMQYSNIFYHRNPIQLGHDANCLETLSIPNSDYIWYLGDSIIITNGGIKRILELIDSAEYDFLSVNDVNRPSIKIASGIYKYPSNLLIDLGWHLTLTGATIYNRKIFVNIKNCYSYFLGTNFPQLGIILSYFPKGENGLYWLNEKIVIANAAKKASYWNTRVFSVFAKDWVCFIMSLPEEHYSNASKEITTKKHSKITGVFETESIINYRLNGILDYNVVVENWKYLKASSNVNIFLILFFSILPRWRFLLKASSRLLRRM